MNIAIIALALAVTGCASDGWQYMAPPRGTYSYSVDGARNNPAGNAAFLTPGARTVTTTELRYGVPTGRVFESR